MNTQEQMMADIAQLQKDLRDLIDEVYRNNFTSHQVFTKYCDFTGRFKTPVVSSLPANAEIGELVTYNGKLYHAGSLNTWTIVGTQS